MSFSWLVSISREFWQHQDCFKLVNRQSPLVVICETFEAESGTSAEIFKINKQKFSLESFGKTKPSNIDFLSLDLTSRRHSAAFFFVQLKMAIDSYCPPPISSFPKFREVLSAKKLTTRSFNLPENLQAHRWLQLRFDWSSNCCSKPERVYFWSENPRVFRFSMFDYDDDASAQNPQRKALHVNRRRLFNGKLLVLRFSRRFFLLA